MMTELGKQIYNMVNSFGLGQFYDPMSGHIIIARDDVNADILLTVNKFLANNTDWCMGYEEDCLFVSPIEDLQ